MANCADALTGLVSRNGCRRQVVGERGAMRRCSCSPLEGRGSASSAVCARCHAASRSRRSSATSALALSRIASA